MKTSSAVKSRFLNPLIFLAGVILILQIADVLGNLNQTVMPAPLSIAQSFFIESDIYLSAFIETLSAALMGLTAAVMLGFLLALIFASFRPLKEAILPFAVFFQTVPIIAVAPLIVIYFGFGLPTVVFCSALVAIFPVLANTMIGLESIQRPHIEFFQLYSASRWKIFWHLRLPSAYTSMFAGLRVSAGLSIIGVVAGEFVAGGGLGALIDSARTQQRLEMVFGSLLLLALIGILFLSIIDLFDFLLRKWRPLGHRIQERL